MSERAIRIKNPRKAGDKTREKIFGAAVDLFSRRGFGNVSMREIADAAGVQKSVIYFHYASKDALLDRIFERLSTGLSDELRDGSSIERLIVSLGPERFIERWESEFNGQMSDSVMVKIWRILLIEMYSNEKIKRFYASNISNAVDYWDFVFRTMIEKRLIKPLDPRVLATDYVSFNMYLYYEYYVLNYDMPYMQFMEHSRKSIEGHKKFFMGAIKA